MDNIPVPDPSLLTVQMLRHEIAVLRDIMNTGKATAETAVNAALQAQKEATAAQNAANTVAISKSEAATTKELDGIKSLLAANTKAADDKIADLTERFNLAMPRAEVDAQNERNEQIGRSVDARLKVLETGGANLAGRLWAIGALLTFANFALSWWGHVHP